MHLGGGGPETPQHKSILVEGGEIQVPFGSADKSAAKKGVVWSHKPDCANESVRQPVKNNNKVTIPILKEHEICTWKKFIWIFKKLLLLTDNQAILIILGAKSIELIK